MEIDSNEYVLRCNNKTSNGTLKFSQKAERGESLAFHNQQLYGIINLNWYNTCELAITEKDSLPYEIYFSFDNVTYKGCGELR